MNICPLPKILKPPYVKIRKKVLKYFVFSFFLFLFVEEIDNAQPTLLIISAKTKLL